MIKRLAKAVTFGTELNLKPLLGGSEVVFKKLILTSLLNSHLAGLELSPKNALL